MRKSLSRDRTLLITDEAQVAKAVQGVSFRRLVCLLAVGPNEDGLSRGRRSTVLILLGANCSGFVCFGPGSEAVHDAIDEIVEREGRTDVVTTWHYDETAEDVAHFFVSVIGADAGTLLVAVLQPADAPIREALTAGADRE